MRSINDVFDGLGGVTAVGVVLKLPLGTVSAWKTRESIPPEYWTKIVSVAERLGVEGLTLEFLASLAAKAAKRRRADSEQARGAA